MPSKDALDLIQLNAAIMRTCFEHIHYTLACMLWHLVLTFLAEVTDISLQQAGCNYSISAK